MTAIAPDLEAMEASASNSMTVAVESVLEMRQLLPDDDIRHLVEFLDEIGEADRSQIERHFNQGREKPVGPAWMTNLLTRARRQGWTVNNGTRSRPRWATTLTTELISGISDISDIVEDLKLETPASERSDAITRQSRSCSVRTPLRSSA